MILQVRLYTKGIDTAALYALSVDPCIHAGARHEGKVRSALSIIVWRSLQFTVT